MRDMRLLLLLLPPFFFFPAAAGAVECAAWDVSGTMAVHQGNGYDVTFVIQQNGGTLSGRAYFGPVKARITGTLSGSEIAITAPWNNGSTGI